MQNDVVDAILEIMEKKHINQRELAERSGFSITSLSRLLSGKRKMAVDDVTLISRGLDVHPTVLLEYSYQRIPTTAILSHEAQEIACEDMTAFHVLNRLRRPCSIKELKNHFNPNLHKRVDSIVVRLKKAGVLSVNSQGELMLGEPTAEALFFEQTEKYNLRISELYECTRRTVPKLKELKEKDRTAWKSINTDMLFIDYFSEDQARTVRRMLEQLRTTIRTFSRLNKLRTDLNTTSNSEELKLRTIYLLSMEYPKAEEASTDVH